MEETESAFVIHTTLCYLVPGSGRNKESGTSSETHGS